MINPYTITKQELVDRFTWRCPHQKSGLAHPHCYDTLRKKVERTGFLDIEASNLNANWGIVYTWAIKELNGKTKSDAISTNDLWTAKYDKRILQSLIDEIRTYDRIVVHYGSDFKFDLPFCRSRSTLWGLDFPLYKFCSVSDTHTMLKAKFRLHSNRLETACDFYNIPSKAHRIKSSVWLSMLTGNKRLMKKAIRYILRHNIEDVISLERLYKKIYKYSANSKRSI